MKYKKQAKLTDAVRIVVTVGVRGPEGGTEGSSGGLSHILWVDLDADYKVCFLCRSSSDCLLMTLVFFPMFISIKKGGEKKKKMGKYICLLANIYTLHSIYTYSTYT